MINVLIVEDQRLFRDGVEAIIGRTDDISVVGTAENGEKAIEQMKLLHPKVDVVLMDIHMPNMDGIATTRFLKENYPEVKVVLLTTTADDDMVISGIVLGADGFLIKTLYAERLIDAIRMAYEGEIVLSGDVARILGNRIRELTMDKKQIFTLRLDRMGFNFTRREIDIAYLLMEHNSNSQIANKLFLGEGTVKNYISEIYHKLDIHNRAKAITYFKQIMQETE
ncbi:response regulator [Oceanobacillus rekensis]|uniref:response regulator n=1 Tax=Oceanobacillus rekensis TaxID=937927 RepID=UPI000B442A15|nr:response regulator transcription factor [Oceanobacillus rekensis]